MYIKHTFASKKCLVKWQIVISVLCPGSWQWKSCAFFCKHSNSDHHCVQKLVHPYIPRWTLHCISELQQSKWVYSATSQRHRCWCSGTFSCTQILAHMFCKFSCIALDIFSSDKLNIWFQLRESEDLHGFSFASCTLFLMFLFFVLGKEVCKSYYLFHINLYHQV